MTLILPDGYQGWKDKISITEHEGLLNAPTKYETGEVCTEEFDKSADIFGSIVKWLLPDTFCPNCNRTDVSPEEAADGSVGVQQYAFPRPDIDMLPRDVIMYGQCGPCRRSTLWGEDHTKVCLPPGYKDRPARWIEANLTAYIRAKIERGEKPQNEGHSYQGKYER